MQARYGAYEASDDALYCASELGLKACLEALLNLGEPVDAVGGLHLLQTALYVESEKDHQAIVRVLLDAGAEVDRTCVSHHKFRTAALYEATVEGQEKIVDMLATAGAGIQLVMQPQCPDFGGIALLVAFL